MTNQCQLLLTCAVYPSCHVACTSSRRDIDRDETLTAIISGIPIRKHNDGSASTDTSWVSWLLLPSLIQTGVPCKNPYSKLSFSNLQGQGGYIEHLAVAFFGVAEDFCNLSFSSAFPAITFPAIKNTCKHRLRLRCTCQTYNTTRRAAQLRCSFLTVEHSESTRRICVFFLIASSYLINKYSVTNYTAWCTWPSTRVYSVYYYLAS